MGTAGGGRWQSGPMATTGRCSGLTWTGCSARDPQGHWPQPRSPGGTSWAAERGKGPGSCWPPPPRPLPASQPGSSSNGSVDHGGSRWCVPSLIVSPAGRAGARVPRSGPCVEAWPTGGRASCGDHPPLACSEVLARPPEPTQSTRSLARPESAAHAGKASSWASWRPSALTVSPRVLPHGRLTTHCTSQRLLAFSAPCPVSMHPLPQPLQGTFSHP